MVEKDFISLDLEKLEEIVLTVIKANEKREGIFSEDFKKYLPQWNIPKELEYFPIRKEPKEKLKASQYLWTCAFFERLMQSRQIIRNASRIWNSENKWIFSPVEITTAPFEKLERIIKNEFQFNIKTKNEETPAKRFLYNAEAIVELYEGDPRRIIQNKTVEEARKNLMQFKGIGRGIANLIMIYLSERELATPIDYTNGTPKIDIHKTRIPLSNQTIKTNKRTIRRDKLTTILEEGFREIAIKNEIPITEIDKGFWIIGSEICAKMNYRTCYEKCPLFKYCTGYIPEDKTNGEFSLVDENRKPLDLRRQKEQTLFEF
jgi:endonuclease III